MKYSVNWLKEQIENGFEPDYLFFWGHRRDKNGQVGKGCLSQWWKQDFTVEGNTYASAEHWMMAGKARLFKDEEMLKKIIASTDPQEAKKLGRKVQNFDHDAWNKNKYEIVREGNLYKFGQYENLKGFLLASGDKVIVEASPYDRIWGIGMNQSDPRALHPDQWQGENLLGFALMEVRDELRK